MPDEPTKRHRLSPADLTPELRARYEVIRAKAIADRTLFAHKPGYEELIDPADRENAAPFYFQLRACVAKLRAAREAAGLTLEDVFSRTGIAAETLSRLETGATTNPDWRTLGLYAVAVGQRLAITAEPAAG